MRHRLRGDALLAPTATVPVDHEDSYQNRNEETTMPQSHSHRSPARRLGHGLCAVLGALALVAASQQAGAAAIAKAPAEPKPGMHYGAVVQLDSGGQAAIKKTLTNIENLVNDPRLKGHITVELVANSKGFDVYVKGNGFEERLKKLQEEGVILAQCANTLKELHVDRSDLYPFITVVPSGMGEITLREAQGWAYIHPGAPRPASDF